MELIEEEYKKIIETFPNVSIVNGFIYHIKIPLINDVYLNIDFKKYPKRPKVILTKSNGEIYSNLMIGSLMNWKKKNAISIIELIKEIQNFVEGMQTKKILIKKELLKGLLTLSRDQHPKEILYLLRIHNGVADEFILPPGAITSNSSGVFFPSRIPFDSSIGGTVHSHPSGNLNPSMGDLKGVFQKKNFHFIIGYPYNDLSCVKCFDRLGNEITFQVIE
jgi:proteasome lid subunit RPN8/RPN11